MMIQHATNIRLVNLSDADKDAPCLRHGVELLGELSLPQHIHVRIEPAIGSREGFRLEAQRGEIVLTGGGAAGVFYGAQELKRLTESASTCPEGVGLKVEQKPDFEIRGTAYFLMKEGHYDWALTPEEFPHFYDRNLLTKYFDYLAENRFNTIFIWTGHLFPSIVELPRFPDATDLTKEQLERNQEQFRWFTSQCAQRNIRVLVHFYNIHIGKALAKSRGIRHAYEEPNAFVEDYIRTTLERFLTEFDSVGLYVCPGEALKTESAPAWIRDVVLAAAKASGNRPPIVIRAWCMDEPLFKKVCATQYDPIYIEGKHNIEKIVSPFPDPRHEDWKMITGKSIVNLHEVADTKPLRWGSPIFIREMVNEWKKAGLMGAEVYGTTSWRWPYALDRLQPDQTAYWPEGPKLLSFERDWIWLEAFGRYLWKAERDGASEEAYWTARLTRKIRLGRGRGTHAPLV